MSISEMMELDIFSLMALLWGLENWVNVSLGQRRRDALSPVGNWPPPFYPIVNLKFIPADIVEAARYSTLSPARSLVAQSQCWLTAEHRWPEVSFSYRFWSCCCTSIPKPFQYSCASCSARKAD